MRLERIELEKIIRTEIRGLAIGAALGLGVLGLGGLAGMACAVEEPKGDAPAAPPVEAAPASPAPGIEMLPQAAELDPIAAEETAAEFQVEGDDSASEAPEDGSRESDEDRQAKE
ncbi:MAG: hypothetical protein V3T33_03790 [Myxococcota bacterium]